MKRILDEYDTCGGASQYPNPRRGLLEHLLELGKAVEQMRDWYKTGQLGFDPS